MRYQNWDVLMFPENCKIPAQEFRTECQIIPDGEARALHSSQVLLPLVTTFIPGLPTGAAFRISVHSWENPEVSRSMLSSSKPEDVVLWEARLFIDGRLAGSQWFDRQGQGQWPVTIDLSTDVNKNGEYEKLKFPAFHPELCANKYWNPGDDLGRIKVIIAEGFSRDSIGYPFERVRNLVIFSFQHAPLEVLEANGIAWPNAAMWRPFLGASYNQHVSAQPNVEALEMHGHSPRHEKRQLPAPIGTMNPPDKGIVRQPTNDPFIEPFPPPVFGNWRARHPSSTDISMKDYSSSANTRTTSSGHIGQLLERNNLAPEKERETMQSPGAYQSLCDALALPSAPSNIPQTATKVEETNPVKSSVPIETESTSVAQADHRDETPAFAPVNDVKSRKENIHESDPGSGDGVNTSIRRVAQPFALATGNNKRQRVVTPASVKAIDAEDEPRASPMSRKVSRVEANPERNGERRALSGIHNV